MSEKITDELLSLATQLDSGRISSGALDEVLHSLWVELEKKELPAKDWIRLYLLIDHLRTQLKSSITAAGIKLPRKTLMVRTDA